jgi:type I restriction enzyme R subunit
MQLADEKSRTIQNIISISFWSMDGTPMSANEFIKQLYGELPELFKDEDELSGCKIDMQPQNALIKP